MPIYEYVCESCEKITEAMQKFADAPLTDCELCGAKGTLSKKISRTSFALKGTGWYSTDYKKSSAPKSESTGESSSGSSSQGSSGSSDGGGSKKDSGT